MLRITGIATGLDTDSIVSSLIQVEQMKVDRVFRQKVRMEWEMEAKTAVNDAIKSFRNTTMSVLSDQNLYSSTAFNTYKVTLDSDTRSVEISAGANAEAQSHTIDSITRIATASAAESTALSTGSGLDKSAALQDLALSTPLVFGGAEADEISFSINGSTFTFNNTDTLVDMQSEINISDAGVRVIYSELSDKLTIRSTDTGSGSSVNITNITGNAFGTGSAFGIETGDFANGQDAVLSIDGYAVTKSDNTFTIDGLMYTLKAASADPIDFAVERDLDTVVDRIQGFVSEYNDLVAILQTAIAEEADSDFYPLTLAEKEAMSEDEISSWEMRAKLGTLQNDRNIQNLLTGMRRMLYDTVSGTGLSLNDIGIKTISYYDGAKIMLDETQLRARLTDNPDQVMNLFIQTSDTESYDEMGHLSRLGDVLSDYTGIYSRATAEQEISRVANRISDLTERMYDKEDALYKKYAAMESAIATLNSQSSWLSSQFL